MGITVKFDNFNIIPGKVTFRSYREFTEDVDTAPKIKRKNYYYKFTEEITPDGNYIAIALSALLNGDYTDIYMDLPVSKEVAEAIRTTFTKADVQFRCEDAPQSETKEKEGGYVLMFSGGMDSFAAKCLFSDIPLVSIEWIYDGQYAHEKAVFDKFSPYIVTTNVRNFSQKMRMAKVVAFLKPKLKFKHIISGDIFEFSTPIGRENMTMFSQFTPRKSLLLEILDITRYNIHFINEVVTTMLVAHYCYDDIPHILSASAIEGVEKRYRKDLLAKAVYRRFGLKPNFIVSRPQETKVKFGNAFPQDYVALYLVKHLGYEEVSNYIDIPEEVVNQIMSPDLTLDFYEKVNTNLIDCVPRQMLGSVIARLSEAGITPYTEKDWHELRQVAKILSPWYKIDPLREQDRWQAAVNMLSGVTSQLKHLNHEIGELHVHNDYLSGQNNQLVSENAKLNNELMTYSKRYQDLTSQLSHSNHKIDELHVYNADLSEQNNELSVINDDLSGQNNRLVSKNSKLNTELTLSSKRYQDLANSKLGRLQLAWWRRRNKKRKGG